MRGSPRDVFCKLWSQPTNGSILRVLTSICFLMSLKKKKKRFERIMFHTACVSVWRVTQMYIWVTECKMWCYTSHHGVIFKAVGRPPTGQTQKLDIMKAASTENLPPLLPMSHSGTQQPDPVKQKSDPLPPLFKLFQGPPSHWEQRPWDNICFCLFVNILKQFQNQIKHMGSMT